MATVLETFVGKYLLNKLAAFIEEKLVMTYRVEDDLKRLETRMKRIGAFLQDADRRRITEESVNNWLSELKDVMFDVDDLIDRWRYYYRSLPLEEPSSSSHSPVCCHLPLSPSFRSIPVRHESAKQVKRLNTRLEEILKDVSILNLKQIHPEFREISQVGARVSSPLIGVDVVGNEIEEGAKKLVKMATIDNGHKFNIVAITGMGGIGKTTLAQKIYNNQTMQNRYTIKMWLSISQTYFRPQLVKEAIRNAGGNPGQAESESELLPILASVISGKSFFLVLDDLWSPDVWVDLLETPLKANASHGFILVTTRDQAIALRIGAFYIHQASILLTKSGWELLCKKAYITDAEDVQNLEGVGIQIVKKCGGLPLAIKVIAGMLAAKGKSKREWERVLRNDTWSIDGLLTDIDRALYLSYEDLSPQLKQCFLYCALYPANWHMNRLHLVKQWIAEGFIEERNDRVIEDSAEDCYYELIQRHLLEPKSLKPDNFICKMHDLLRSLALYISQGECLSSNNQILQNAAFTPKLRRLSLKSTDSQTCIPDLAAEPLRLRTFIIFKCLSQIEDRTFVRVKLLRVLIINEKGFNSIPKSIGDLIHLRMLDLSRTSVSTLPKSIGSLTNLLFLNLQGCKLLSMLPKAVTRLCNLRNLNLGGVPLTSVPKGIEGLQKLTDIGNFQVGDGSDHENQNGWDLNELEGLSQLRRISISNLERARDVAPVLSNKTHLRQLYLIFSEVVGSRGYVDEELEIERYREILEKLCPPPSIEKLRIRNYRCKMVPRWMSLSSTRDLFPNVLYIDLIGWSCCIDLPPFGLLRNLKYLRVQDASSIVTITLNFLGMDVPNGPNFLPIVFPKLEYLIFKNMPNWEEWLLSSCKEMESPSWQLMPHLKQLTIKNCPKLRALPNGLNRLIAIEEFVVSKVDSIRCISNLAFECETLVVNNNRQLETLSNLLGVKRLEVSHTHNLRHVSRLDSVEYIQLIDYTAEGVPEWLITLMEERKDHSIDKLHLDLFCRIALLERCLKDGPDWPLIKCFSSVSAYSQEQRASLAYTREPESYYASLKDKMKEIY